MIDQIFVCVLQIIINQLIVLGFSHKIYHGYCSREQLHHSNSIFVYFPLESDLKHCKRIFKLFKPPQQLVEFRLSKYVPKKCIVFNFVRPLRLLNTLYFAKESYWYYT